MRFLFILLLAACGMPEQCKSTCGDRGVDVADCKWLGCECKCGAVKR